MCMWHSCYQTWRCFFFKDSFIEDFTVNKTNRKPNRMGFQCEHLFGFSSLKKNKHQLFMFISIRKIYCRLCTFVGFFFFFSSNINFTQFAKYLQWFFLVSGRPIPAASFLLSVFWCPLRPVSFLPSSLPTPFVWQDCCLEGTGWLWTVSHRAPSTVMSECLKCSALHWEVRLCVHSCASYKVRILLCEAVWS